MILALHFNSFWTKCSLRKLLYCSLPSSTKVKMHFAAFSSTSSPDTKLSNFISSIWVSTYQYVNCETLCIASCTSLARLPDSLWWESSPSWNHPLLYVRSTTPNGQQLIVDGFLFDDKAFFSRLAYYFTYIFFGPLYSFF